MPSSISTWFWSAAARGDWPRMDPPNVLWFFVAFALASAVLLRRGWWVPGGLSAALAVAVFPAVAVSFLKLIDVWPSDPFFQPFEEFSGWTLGVGLATAFVGLVAWWLTRFSFVLAVAIGAILVSAQLLTPCFDESPSEDVRAATALVSGAILFV